MRLVAGPGRIGPADRLYVGRVQPYARGPVVVLVAVMALAGCGSAPSVADLSLEELSLRQTRYHEQMVRTEGVVRTADSPRHYWIEDPNLNRVELLPHAEVQDLLGATVRVEGLFTFRDDEGRRIQVDELTVLSPG